MKNKKDDKEIKVRHIMANGEIRDTLKGYQFSADDLPEVARRIIYQLITQE